MKKEHFTESDVLAAFYGMAIGDALGVPVEFKTRDYLKKNPVKDFLGYQCWHQPPGTFSDDSSMAFCTTESLCNGYNLDDIGKKFVDWYKTGYWGAHDKIFDIGGTTRFALNKLVSGHSPLVSGEFYVENNGNGSLMRILPMVFWLFSEEDIKKRYRHVKEVSSITHAHFRSVFACFIYVELGIQYLKCGNLKEAYSKTQSKVLEYAQKQEFNPEEVDLFERVLKASIWDCKESEINSDGYVLSALEASLWCLFTTKTYDEAVLKAVNLGEDTDTTASITGGLAGLVYGLDSINPNWIIHLAKTNEVKSLATRFYQSCHKNIKKNKNEQTT